MSFWDRLFGRKRERFIRIKDCRDCYFFRDESGYYGYCRASGSNLVVNMANLCEDYSTSASEARQKDVVDRLTKFDFVLSDVLQKSDDTELYITTGTMSKSKEITFEPKAKELINVADFRISFDLRTIDGVDHINGQIYKNGTAIGTLRKKLETEYETFTEDIEAWQYGDTIELWCMLDNTTYKGYCRNFRVYADIVEMTYEPEW